jgi:hypothetical protein
MGMTAEQQKEADILELEIEIEEEELALNSAPQEQSGIDYARGLLQSQARGSLSGFGDEVVGGARAVIDKALPNSTYDFGGDVSMETPSFPQTYAQYRDDERAVTKQFEDENPKTALAANIAGGLGNPLNKVAPTAGTGGLWKSRALAASGRGVAEGALQGLGEGEGDIGSQLDSAQTGAKWGGGLGGVINLAGGGLGKIISTKRVQDAIEYTVEAADGTMQKVFKPLNMASPESLLGKFYRNVVGPAFGGGEIGQQESRYLNTAPEFSRFADPETGLVVPQAAGTKVGVNDAVDRVTVNAADAAEELGANSAARVTALGNTREAIERTAEEAKLGNQQRLLDVTRETDLSVPAIKPAADRAAAAEVIEEAIPDAMPPEVAAQIRAIPDQLEQEAALTSWWNKNAYKGVKDAEFQWDAGIRDEIEDALPDMPAYARAELENIIQKIDRAAERASKSGLNVVNEGSTLLDASGKLINPPSVSEISTIDGDTLMEVRNFFARNANGVNSGKGKANRLVAKYFDDMIGDQLGKESDEYLQLLDFNKRYNAKRTLEKSANQARRGARDITTSDITSKARDKSDVQSRAIDKSRSAKEGTALERTRAARAADEKQAADKAALTAKNAGLKQTREQVAAEKAQLAADKRANTKQRNEDKGVLLRGGRGVLAEDTSAGNRVVATATLGLPFTMLGAGGLVAGAPVAKALTTKTAQKAMAGQLGVQEKLAKALREGDMATYTTLLSRFGAGQATAE